MTTVNLKTGETEEHVEQGSVFGLKSRNVCAPCNNIWLERIENEAWPSIEAFAKNKARSLTTDDLAVLALWAGLVNIMAEYRADESSKPFSEADRRHIRNTRTLPSLWSVYLGREHPEEASKTGRMHAGRRYAIRKEMRIPSGRNDGVVDIQHAEFRVFTTHILWLVLQVVVSDSPLVVDRFRKAWEPIGMVRIFPLATNVSLPTSTRTLLPLGSARFDAACHDAAQAWNQNIFFTHRKTPQ